MKKTAFAKNTAFGIKIRFKLLELNRTQEWLICQVKEKTNLYFDSSYLHKIMVGKNAAPRIIEAICEVLDIEQPKPEEIAQVVSKNETS